MQAIKYINPKGKEVVFSKTPPYIFESVKGISAVDAEFITTECPGQDGNTIHDLNMADREITLSFHIKGADRERMYRHRKELIAVLSSKMHQDGKPGKLVYTNDHGQWWIPAYVKIGPRPETRIQNYNQGSVVFRCPNPFFRSMSPQLNALAYLTGGLEFPLDLDIENKVEFGTKGYRDNVHNLGDVDAPVVITIHGPATTPQVTKMSTGEYIRIKRDLAIGDQMIIETEPNNFNAVIKRSTGVVESAMGYLDLTSEPFLLSPGENVLEYNSGDDTTTARVIVEVYAWYGGV